MTSVTKVISGGQIGADIAGVAAAKFLGIETGGFMPRHFKQKDRYLLPEEAAHYGFVETEDEGYPFRTALNVQHSDGTIRFAYDFGSRGELCTLREIQKAGKPYFDVDITIEERMGDEPEIQLFPLPVTAQRWLAEYRIRTLNVAGNADKRIEWEVYEYLKRALSGAS